MPGPRARAPSGGSGGNDPDLPVDFVRELLISKHTDRALTEPFDLEPAKKAASKTRAPRRHG